MSNPTIDMDYQLDMAMRHMHKLISMWTEVCYARLVIAHRHLKVSFLGYL